MSPFSFAVRIRLVRIFGAAPENSQKAVITCECSEMPLPRSLFKFLLPIKSFVVKTAGVKGPNLARLPMVHFAVDVARLLHVIGDVNELFSVTVGATVTKA